MTPKVPASSLWVLAALAALIVGARLYTVSEPMECDITTYAVYAHEMNRGSSLYSDLRDNKPPAIFATYALAEKLVGYGPTEVLFLWILATLLSLFGIYWAGRVFGEAGGLWAAAFWAVVCTDMKLEANQPNAEVFMNACQVWAFALAVSKTKESSWRYGAIGLLGALSTLYKPQDLIFVVLLAMAGGGVSKIEGRVRWNLEPLFMMVFPSLAGWGIMGLYFEMENHFRDFWDLVVAYNSHYSGNVLLNLLEGLIQGRLFKTEIRWIIWPLLLLAFSGAYRSVREYRARWILLGAFALSAYVETASPGKWHPHYYQLGLPVLAIGGGWGAALLWKEPLVKTRIFPILVMIAVFLQEAAFYRMPPLEWSTKMYFGSFFADSYRLGSDLDRILLPGETFYEFGNETGLYFVSRREPPTGVILAWHATEGPFAEENRKRLLSDLDKAPPELIVVDQKTYPDYVGLFTGYRVWVSYPKASRFLLLTKKGGELEKRIRQNPKMDWWNGS
jgi:hypothetical protein